MSRETVMFIDAFLCGAFTIIGIEGLVLLTVWLIMAWPRAVKSPAKGDES